MFSPRVAPDSELVVREAVSCHHLLVLAVPCDGRHLEETMRFVIFPEIFPKGSNETFQNKLFSEGRH